MSELDAGYERGPETIAKGRRYEYAPKDVGLERLTPEQRQILARMERKVAALGEQNRALLAEFHKLTGNRYVPERLYVPAPDQ